MNWCIFRLNKVTHVKHDLLNPMEEFSQFEAKCDNVAKWLSYMTRNQMGSPSQDRILDFSRFLHEGIVASNLHRAWHVLINKYPI